MKSQNYDKRIFRFLSILNRLDSGKSVSTPNIAKEFNVSLRTIQRDVELLNLTGFPLVAKTKGTYSFVDGFSLKRSMVTNEEASLLSLMFDIAKSLGGSFEDSFRGIISKVLNQGKDSSFYVKMPEGFKLEKDTPFYRELDEAVDSSSKVSMQYEDHKGKKSELIVSPLKLIFYDGFWYLLCLRDDKGGVIKLRFDNIKGVKTLDEHYEKSKNVKTMLDQSVNVWFSENRARKVILEIDPSVAQYFKRKIYFPLQKIVKEHKNGRLTLETKVSSQFMEIIPTIHQWIPMIKIVSPVELKEKVKSLIRQYQKNF